MNWYKKAQQRNNEWRWGKMVAYFGLPFLAAFSLWVGINITKLKNHYMDNPQEIEQKLVEYQNVSDNQPEETPSQPEETPTESFNMEEVASMIERHEGRRHRRYLDTKGIPTIGVGFNLIRRDAIAKMRSLGANYMDIVNGRTTLNDEQIDSLFDDNLKEAIETAQSFIPDFGQHPASVQTVLIDMAFNLGTDKLGQFKKFREALQKKDYQTAAKEMVDSRWYGQVGNRSKELVDIMNKN
jgi:lysozyme